MNAKQVKNIVQQAFKAKKPKLFIAGPPGCGKTSVVYQAFREMGVPVYVFQATLYDPVELKGLPVFDQQIGEARYLRFKDMPSGDNGVLFIDDLPHAPNQTQNAFMRLILEGVAGAWDLKGLFPIAAGNRVQDRAGAKDMQTAMANRFVHINMDVDGTAWREWAIAHNISPEVTGFISSPHGQEYLAKFDPSRQVNPTPRSWEAVSDLFHLKLAQDTLREALAGTIGEEASTRFMEWMRVYDKLPDLTKILGGENIYPETQDIAYAVVSGLVSMVTQMDGNKDRAIKRLFEYAVYMPDGMVDLGVVLSQDLMHMNSEIMYAKDPIFRKWEKRYTDMIFKKD